jgi:hypothetical protein
MNSRFILKLQPAHFLPLILVSLLPQYNLFIIRARCQNRAIPRVRPGYLPNRGVRAIFINFIIKKTLKLLLKVQCLKVWWYHICVFDHFECILLTFLRSSRIMHHALSLYIYIYNYGHSWSVWFVFTEGWDFIFDLFIVIFLDTIFLVTCMLILY